jgi:hypothetical protein
MDWKKFWPTLIPIVALLVDAFSGTIQTLLAAHPSASLIIVTLLTAVANAVTPKKVA